MKSIFALLLLATMASAQTVTRVYIVDKTGAFIYSPLTDNQYFQITQFPKEGFSIYADVSPRPYKVVFQYDALPSRTEFGAPYALYGDYIVKPAVVGTHTVNITPYISSTRAGVTTRITFTIRPIGQKITGTISSTNHIVVLGDSTYISTVLFDTASKTFSPPVKSIRYLINDYGPSVLMLGPPYWYIYKPLTAGLHYVYGSGLDTTGTTFYLPTDTILVVTPEDVKNALFVKYSYKKIEAIVTKH